MAKYEVKMSCGHTEIVNLFGAMKDRERKIAWLGEHGICTDCYKAHRDAAHAAATAEAAIKATEENLPTLTGSEKQINWALTIRANKLADLAKMVEEGNAKIADQAQRDKNQMACQATRNVLVAKTEAKFWIDNRDVNAKKLIAANNLQDEFKAEFAKLSDAASGKQMAIDIKLGDFNLDYSRYDEVIDADAKIESNAEVESNGNDAEAKTKMKTIETKMATNGVKLYYVDGKRTSCEVALQAAADSRENLFTIEYATRHNAYFTGRILDATQVYESTSKAVLKELELKIDEYHGFAVKLHTIGWVEICKLFNKNYAKSLINKIENAFIRGEYGVKIDTYGKVSILPAPVIEPNPDDYAVSPDAFDEAVNAEIELANNKHTPEFKYYLQSCRPIAGAVPNGYISATQGEMKAYSLRSDGSISIVPRKVVFGVVVYDHPLSDQQIINYDLHVDPRNPKVEPDTTELSDTEPDTEPDEPKYEYKPEVDPIIKERQDARNEYYELNHVRNLIEKDVDKIERLRDRCKPNSPKHKEYNQLLADVDPIIRAFGDKFIAAQDRYNQSLTLRTDEERAATQKAIDEHNKDLDARGIKYFATVRYYPHGHEGEDMENFFKDCQTLKEATDFVSQEDIDGVYVGGIYDAGWEITDRNHNLIADHNTGIKMTNTTQAGFLKDKINRESKSIDDYTTDRDAVFNLLPEVDDLNDVEIDDTPTNKPVDNRSLIRKWNEIIFSPEFKHETAKMVFTRQGSKQQLKIVWSYIFIKFDDVKGKFKFYLGTLFLAKYDTPAQVDKVIALIQAAIARGDKTFTFPTIDELIDPPDTEPRYAMTVKESIDGLNHSINWAKGVLATMQGDTYSDDWQDWTRSELETAITDWTTETEILAYAHSATTPTFNHQQKKSLRDSLNRAKQIALENIRVARRNHNKKAEDYERELYDICNQALKEVA